MKNLFYKSIDGKISYTEAVLKGKYKKYVKLSFPKKSKQPRKKMILTAGPSVSSKELAYTLDAALNGWNENNDYYLIQLHYQK